MEGFSGKTTNNSAASGSVGSVVLKTNRKTTPNNLRLILQALKCR